MTALDGPLDALEGDSTRRGGNQIGLRQYNERLVLSLIHEAGALPKADLARITRLSSQTVTVIVNRLLHDGLVRKKEVIRGRIGQPSTPIELNPDGALSIGIKIGRRSLDILALSFDRRVVARTSHPYDALDRDTVFGLIGPTFASLLRELTPTQTSRLIGVGIAAPTAIEDGVAVIGDPDGPTKRWRETDLLARVEEVTGHRGLVLNDATAACLAELEFGETRQRSFVYFYLSTLIGGGLVIEGRLIAGRTGNAGAVGALPLALSSATRRGRPPQLIEATSLNRLEVIAAGQDVPMAIFREDGDRDREPEGAALACFEAWCGEAADALALAAISGTSFVEAEAIVVDGVLRRPLMARLIERVEARMADYNLVGIVLPELRIGRVGFDARAFGAALLPMNEQFAPDNRVVLKA